MLDRGFGMRGRVSVDLGGSAGYAVAAQPDGRIVVAGAAPAGQGLIRLLEDGTLDASFGEGGIVENPAAGLAIDVGLQSDGRILVLGFDTLSRYRADGSPDTSFGQGGVVQNPLPGQGSSGLAVLASGRILVAGNAPQQGTQFGFAAARFNADGTRDLAFGSDGLVFTYLGANATASAMCVQDDGKILVAGGASSGGAPRFTVIRYTPRGRLDQGFAMDGVASLEVTAYAFDVAVQGDGRILLTGGFGAFKTTRLNTDGTVDQAFGRQGVVVTKVGDVPDETVARAMAVQDDGRILVAGTARYTDRSTDFTVVRYLAS
jgi:uncharacterized delta-60 repeat protein